MSRQRPNTFAGPYTDRSRPPRQDAAAVAAALADPQSRLLPVWRAKNLLQRAPEPRAALLPAARWEEFAADPGELVMLGTWRETTVFACEVASTEAPVLAEGGEFVDLRAAAGLLDPEEAGLLAYARALVWWRSRHRRCGACGGPTQPREAGHVMACVDPACGQQSFPRLDPAVIVLVTDGERALLGRQASWPPGRYSTIAGFVEPGESLEDAVAREVLEETGVQVTDVRYHSSQPWPFPSSLMLGFHAQALTTELSLNDAELEDARWFTRADLARGEAGIPPPISISHRLIMEWYDACAERPLAEEAGVRRWDVRR